MPESLHAERDRLDHQRSRIEEILSNGLVSAELEDHLRRRLLFINQRLVELEPMTRSTVLAGPPREAYSVGVY